jgi:hypothetical protein
MREWGRTAVRTLLVAMLGMGVLGMGSFGGGRDAGLPARDFRATFTDLDGTRMSVTRVTAGGDTSLEGELGRGRMHIPFENITRVTFQPTDQRDQVRAEVVLREGQPVTLTMRSSTTFYGQTPAGAYQIRARDLKAVDFGQ